VLDYAEERRMDSPESAKGNARAVPRAAELGIILDSE
jgi:hypothetical protein